jgi:hypothetical protein
MLHTKKDKHCASQRYTSTVVGVGGVTMVSEEYPLDRNLPTKSSRNPIELVIGGVLAIAAIAAVVLAVLVFIKVNDACAFYLTDSILLSLHCTIFSYAIRFFSFFDYRCRSKCNNATTK